MSTAMVQSGSVTAFQSAAPATVSVGGYAGSYPGVNYPSYPAYGGQAVYGGQTMVPHSPVTYAAPTTISASPSVQSLAAPVTYAAPGTLSQSPSARSFVAAPMQMNYAPQYAAPAMHYAPTTVSTTPTTTTVTPMVVPGIGTYSAGQAAYHSFPPVSYPSPVPAVSYVLPQQAAPAAQGAQSLYDRIGGEAAVEAAVDLFYSKIVADPLLKKIFSKVPMEGLKKMQKKFLTKVFGGPDAYTGRSIREAHQGKGINEQQFGAVAGHLSATLKELGVPDGEHDEVMAIAGSVKDDVVEVKGSGKKSKTKAKKNQKGGFCC